MFFCCRIRPRPSKKLFKQHVRNLRPSLTPGTVLILLAGSHKGKRVVLLKQLDSGLLLVTGPFLINACPLRRVSQRYVIATQTKIDVSSVKLPENINDVYFRRERKKRAKKEEGDIFQSKKEVKHAKLSIIFVAYSCFLFVTEIQGKRTEEDRPETCG